MSESETEIIWELSEVRKAQNLFHIRSFMDDEQTKTICLQASFQVIETGSVPWNLTTS